MCTQARLILLILSLLLHPFAAWKAHAEDAEDILDNDTVQSLVDSDPDMHFKLKDGAGKTLSMNKWTKGKVTVFVLYEKTNPLKTIVSSATKTVPALFKDEDVKVNVKPANGTTPIPAKSSDAGVIKKKVLVSPEYTEYTLQNKTVMKYVPTEIGGGDKPVDIKAKATIGADEYDVLEAYTVIKDK